jgi:hypothetical protein
VVAGRSIAQNASITASAAGMGVELQATAGAVTLADGSAVQTNRGNVRISATGDITVGAIDARADADRSTPGLSLQSDATTPWGSVSLISSGGSILDNGIEAVAATVDVFANELRLSASASTKSVATNANALETEIAKLSALVGGTGLYVLESSTLSVGQTADVTVQRVGSNAALTATTDLAQSDLMVTGNLVLQTLAGSIVVTEGDTDTGTVGIQVTSGNVLLKAVGTGANIELGADLILSNGNLSLDAAQDILQNADVTSQASAKTVDMVAGRHITMSQDNGTTRAITTNLGDVRLFASAGSITLESIYTGVFS